MSHDAVSVAPAEDSSGGSSQAETGPTKGSSGGLLKEILITVAVVLIISFLLKTFLFRLFYIPSGSMENTLQLQDKIGVNAAEPWLGPLERGDVVVFEDTQGWLPPVETASNPVRQALEFVGLAPDRSQQYLIKRVIGVEGDTVTCCSADGRITVNGVAIDEPYVHEGDSPSDIPFEVTVPEDSYFVLGDHRSASADSRYHLETGTEFVSHDDVVGSGFAILWPADRWSGISSYPDTFAPVEDASGSGQ